MPINYPMCFTYNVTKVHAEILVLDLTFNDFLKYLEIVVQVFDIEVTVKIFMWCTLNNPIPDIFFSYYLQCSDFFFRHLCLYK